MAETKYVLKWEKEMEDSITGELYPMFAMPNPILITKEVEKAIQFDTMDDAQKFKEENKLNYFSIVPWNVELKVLSGFTEEQKRKIELNKKLRETIDKFIADNNLSCEKCKFSCVKKGKAACSSKLYCIVKESERVGLYINYTKSEETE